MILLSFFEQRLLNNHRRYHYEIWYTYSKHSNGGKCEFL